jgi:SAM-dependent methyltransferase
MSTNCTNSATGEAGNVFCPLCKSDNVRFFDRHPSVDQQLWKCNKCKFYFVFPHKPYVHSEHDEVEKDAIDGYWANEKAIKYYLSWREEENKRLAEWALKNISPYRVLEIGIGDGPLTKYISGHTSDYWGIEPDANAIMRARKKLPSIANKLYALRSDELEQSDVFTTMKGTFDGIFLFSVLEHIAEPIVFFDTAFELLKRGGRLIISVPNSNNFYLFYLLRRLVKIEPWTYFHISFFKMDNLSHALESHGFKIIMVQRHTLLTQNSINYFASRYNSRSLWLLMNAFKVLHLDRLFGMTTYLLCCEKA